MANTKTIPRAVLEERLKVLEESKKKHRLFAVKFGAYIALLIGVLGSQVVQMSDDLMATLQPIELGQVGGGLLVATVIYAKILSNKKDVAGMAKKGNVFRVLITAFQAGLTWMTLVGAWW